MIQEIIKNISNINYSYIITSILFLITSILLLNEKKINNYIKIFYIIIYILISILGLYYTNDILNYIFNLKYLSIKLYLFILLIINTIMLVTLNKKNNKTYKKLNIIIYITSLILLISNIIIVIGNKTNSNIIPNISNIIKLIDLNIILFIIYLDSLQIAYITKKIRNKKKKHIINGKDCSIIFEDTNKNNIKQNYKILKKNINGKLINGYTLEETIKLKEIINKLQIDNINNLKLDINKLNMITKEEYHLLKKYIDNNKILKSE